MCHLGFGENAHSFSIVVGIAIFELEALVPRARERDNTNGRPLRTIEIPVGNPRTDVELIKGILDGTLDFKTNRHWNATDPHVLFVTAVGNPQVTAGRITVALGNAAHIL